jgi:predicted RND superfamily exporter protein
MQTIMKNPQKILSLVKDIGGKLEEKIKSGQVKESELLEEATDLIDKMKDMPGIKEMMNKMGMNGKIDFKAMANKMKQNMTSTKTKERLQKKMEEKKAQISKKNEDTFVVKVDDTTPLRSKKPKRKKNKKPTPE